MTPQTLVVVNPLSRNGATGRRWAGIERKLCDLLGALDVEHTRAPRDAERIARNGVLSGVERIVVAGGDGTLSEIATGLLEAGLANRVEIGVLPLGSGGDFLRTLGVPARLDDAIRCLANGKPRRVDAGRITFCADSGERRTSYFLNAASVGVSGLITQLVNQSSKILGSGTAFLIGTVRGILRHENLAVRIRVDGQVVHDGPLVLATAANGRYFGAGMRVAPGARLDDAELDVVVVSGLSKPRLLTKLAKIYTGTHLNDAAVTLHHGRRIEFEAETIPVRIEVDGEPLGVTPAQIEILPAAITLIGPVGPSPVPVDE